MALLLSGKTTDLDGIQVTRILPNAKKRMVGPFIFLDHMGPVEFAPGDGIDVKPHPHIGLATLTYLTEGAILHRDSLGNELEILPGEVNWMIAGKGIVHSERETDDVRNQPHRLNGVQCWLALPKEQAECEPEFLHYSAYTLPAVQMNGIYGRLIAGSAYGLHSPVKTHSPLFYLDLSLAPNARLTQPENAEECAVYLLEGSLSIEGSEQSDSKAPSAVFHAGDFVLLERGEALIAQEKGCRLLMLGGDHWPTVPRINWNFVSFDWSRIQQARSDWQAGRFPLVPGDEDEFTPLP